MAYRMYEGYFMHVAAIRVATDPRAPTLSPNLKPGQIVPVGYVVRKDSCLVGRSAFGCRRCPEATRLFRSCSGTGIITPSAQRRGHGNTFRIDLTLIAEFPAHNRLARIMSDNKTEFEITANLQDQPVLFDFMGLGDILDLFMSVSHYLERTGNGENARGNS
jgi:hypothetical protein